MKRAAALQFFKPDFDQNDPLPYIAAGIKAGFPSPAADFDESRISLDQIVVRHREATFYARANGHSMQGAGIDHGDVLVIDRSLEPRHNKIAVCYIDGEFTVKRIHIENGAVLLKAENPDYPAIVVTEANELIIWGIVTHVLKEL